MQKRISYQQFQSVKSVAKAIDPVQRKIKPLQEKIKTLQEELDAYTAQVNALQAGIVQIIGFPVTDLIKKVTEPTGATDPKTGKPIKTTKYVTTDIVTYDEQHKQYVITIPEESENAPEEETPKAEPQVTPVQEAPVAAAPTEEFAEDEDGLPFSVADAPDEIKYSSPFDD